MSHLNEKARVREARKFSLTRMCIIHYCPYSHCIYALREQSILWEGRQMFHSFLHLSNSTFIALSTSLKAAWYTLTLQKDSSSFHLLREVKLSSKSWANGQMNLLTHLSAPSAQYSSSSKFRTQEMRNHIRFSTSK